MFLYLEIKIFGKKVESRYISRQRYSKVDSWFAVNSTGLLIFSYSHDVFLSTLVAIYLSR